ncbi:MAG TPA: glycosyltransferase [Candidatus Dormibacteraeota bacterium]
MRVLVVVSDLTIGGTQRYLARVMPRLISPDLEIEVCALDGGGPLAAELAAAGVAVHPTSFPRWTSAWRVHYVVRSLRELSRLARRGRFDAIHTHLYWSDTLGAIAGRLARLARTIVSRRSLHSFRHPNPALYHWLESAANLAAGELIANSQAVLRDTVARESFVPRRRTVIYNGVEPSEYTAARAPRGGPLRLVCVGRLAAPKNQRLAVEALALARAGGCEATLTLVGDGPDRGAIADAAAGLGVADVVELAGEQDDPRLHLEAAHAFLLTSEEEGFSNALLEAMACALPAIATDTGGNPEALVGGRGGTLVPPGDVRALARAITDFGSRRSELVEMGRFNRARVESEFSLNVSARRLRDWYLNCES